VAEVLQIPQTVQDLVQRSVPNGGIRLAAASDLGADRRYGEQWILLAGDRVLVCELEGGQANLLIDLPLHDISEFQIENLVGGAVLQAVVDGHRTDLIPYTNALAKRFANVRVQLDAAAKGKPVPEIAEPHMRCPKCGLVLGEETRVCPRCVERGAVLRRLLTYTKPYRAGLVVIGLLMLAATGFGLVPPALTRVLVDKVLVPKANAHLLPWLVLALAGSSILGTVLTVWRGRLAAWLGGRISFDIRAQLYHRLQWLSLRYYDRHPMGAIVSRLTQDSGGIQDFLAFGLPWIAGNGLIVVGVAIALVVLNWKLALLVLIPTPVVSLLIRLLWRRVHRAFHRFWHGWSRFHTIVNDSLARVKIIKAFTRENQEIERFRLRNADLFRASVAAEQTFATFFPIIGLAVGSGSLLVWYFGGRLVLSAPTGAGFTLGDLMAFLGYLAMLYGPLNFLAQSAQWVSRAMTAAERVFEVLDAEADVEEASAGIVLDRPRGEVEFRNVTFGYQRGQPVLKDLSFSVPAGTMLGLVGRSGVGKTTVINVLCRFYPIDEGQILLDGVDIRDLDLSAYRSLIGVVFQEPFLFSGTIAENIAYGRPGASLEEIMAAAKAANAHDFILRKPDGYDEQVGERGSRLSAGEKQRLCIARAILHDPVILVLDEATANVDLETEEQIQEALVRLVEGRTTFAIAHRLSTLRNADQLLVLEDGKRAEFGTHAELARNKGVYSRLLSIYRKTSRVRAVDG